MTFPTKILLALAIVLAAGQAFAGEVAAKDSDVENFTAHKMPTVSVPIDQKSLSLREEVPDILTEASNCQEECQGSRPQGKTPPALKKIPLALIKTP